MAMVGRIASGQCGGQNIAAALFSRWFTSGILIQQNESAVVASLGNYSWAVLLLPLKEYDEGGVTYYVVDSEASPTMTHVTNPNVWKLVPHAPSRRLRGLAFEKAGQPVSLVRMQLVNSKIGDWFFGEKKEKRTTQIIIKDRLGQRRLLTIGRTLETEGAQHQQLQTRFGRSYCTKGHQR